MPRSLLGLAKRIRSLWVQCRVREPALERGEVGGIAEEAPVVQAVESPCQTCPVPGRCCRAIVLNGGRFLTELDTIEEVEAYLEALNVEERQRAADCKPSINGVMPFRPLFKTQQAAWYFWCPNLNPETGRCMDYANRPFACVDYQPGCDAMCAIFDEKNHEHDWVEHHSIEREEPDWRVCRRCGVREELVGEGHEVKEDEDDRVREVRCQGGGQVPEDVGG